MRWGESHINALLEKKKFVQSGCGTLQSLCYNKKFMMLQGLATRQGNMGNKTKEHSIAKGNQIGETGRVKCGVRIHYNKDNLSWKL